MLRRFSGLILFLLPLAAMAAEGAARDTAAVVSVDGRKYVMCYRMKQQTGKGMFAVTDACFEDERSYWERVKRDSAELFLKTYEFPEDELLQDYLPEYSCVLVNPKPLVQTFYSLRPYWKRAVREAFSAESLAKLAGADGMLLFISCIYDQEGTIRCLWFHLTGEVWLRIPLEELARFDRKIREHILVYNQFARREDLPARYYVEGSWQLKWHDLFDETKNFRTFTEELPH